MSLDISMKELLETGVHFGHRTNRWDPRMKSYIFTERNGIHIVDLQQTVERLKEAYNLIRDCIAEGGSILLVGTKRQAQETILTEAERCGMPYVVERWMPGTLTNWSTIHARIMELERLEKMRDSGEMERLIKKEQLTIERKINRLLVHLSGIRDMNGLPDLLFVVDVTRNYTAVHEANLKGVPVVAMVDTNCDPTNIDYLIPSNDDAIRAIKLIVHKIADAVLEGKAMRKEDEAEEALKPIGEDETRERVRAAISLEEDVDDEVLLGDTVLKKLAKTRQEEAEAEEAKAKELAEKEAGKEEEIKEEEEKPAEEFKAEEKIEKKETKPRKPAKSTKGDDKKEEEKPVKEAKAEEKEAKPRKSVKSEDKEVKEKPAKEAKDRDMGKEKEEEKPIEELGLNTRANNALASAGIMNLANVLAKLKSGDDALLDLPGIGQKTLTDIKKVLKKMGYKIPETAEEEPKKKE